MPTETIIYTGETNKQFIPAAQQLMLYVLMPDVGAVAAMESTERQALISETQRGVQRSLHSALRLGLAVDLVRSRRYSGVATEYAGKQQALVGQIEQSGSNGYITVDHAQTYAHLLGTGLQDLLNRDVPDGSITREARLAAIGCALRGIQNDQATEEAVLGVRDVVRQSARELIISDYRLMDLNTGGHLVRMISAQNYGPRGLLMHTQRLLDTRVQIIAHELARGQSSA